MRTIRLQKTNYLGGLPEDPKPTRAAKVLFVSDESIGAGAFGPKHGVIRWADVASVSFDSASAKKSRAGKAMAFGVLALAAKKTQDSAEIVVTRKDGEVALFQVIGTSGIKVRGKIQPFLSAAGIAAA